MQGCFKREPDEHGDGSVIGGFPFVTRGVYVGGRRSGQPRELRTPVIVAVTRSYALMKSVLAGPSRLRFALGDVDARQNQPTGDEEQNH